MKTHDEIRELLAALALDAVPDAERVELEQHVEQCPECRSELDAMREVAAMMGNTVELIADVGVAGIHRLLAQREGLQSARVLIVCAGMEGALPTVVAGLVNAPVLAVPTSVGYGASFGGVAALLGMLNTCAPNVSVVNIDNGFGAACIASLINRL